MWRAPSHQLSRPKSSPRWGRETGPRCVRTCSGAVCRARVPGVISVPPTGSGSRGREPGFLRRRGPELGLGHPRTAGICGAGQLRHPDLRTGPHPLERLGVLPDWEENSCLFSGRTAASEASLRGRGSRRRQREARPLVRAGGGLLLEPPPPSWHHRAVLLPRGGRLRSPLQPPGQACRLMCCRTREWG